MIINEQYKEKNKYKLFIDELGTASIRDFTSDLYILSGCLVEEFECDNIKIWADHIKFKYWGHTDIIFHSREIGRKENNFSIFKDKRLFNCFIKDLENFLIKSDFRIFFILVNKSNAYKNGWDNIKVYRDTNLFLLRNFISILLSINSKGEIIIESSSTQKDAHLLYTFNYFLENGVPEFGIDQKLIREILTSVSFVTKQNYDIEEQIADLFAYTAKLKYSLNSNQNKIINSDYDKMMLTVFDKKIFNVHLNPLKADSRFLKNLNSFLVLP